jgi:hypothetical protein
MLTAVSIADVGRNDVVHLSNGQEPIQMKTTTAITTALAANSVTPNARIAAGTSIITAALFGLVLAVNAASSARAQADDPTAPCNNPTNNPEGDSEFCYIGPRTPEAMAPRRITEDAYRALGRANTWRRERPSNVRPWDE